MMNLIGGEQQQGQALSQIAAKVIWCLPSFSGLSYWNESPRVLGLSQYENNLLHHRISELKAEQTNSTVCYSISWCTGTGRPLVWDAGDRCYRHAFNEGSMDGFQRSKPQRKGLHKSPSNYITEIHGHCHHYH